MAKAKAATKAKGKVEKPVEVEENGDNAVVEEPKKRGRGKPVKAEVAEETVDVKPKRATKAAQPAKAKEESVPKSTPAEPKTNGVAKSKPAKKPASKRTQKADAEKGESEKEMPVESPKKRARKNETKVENEEPEKKRGKKKADEVEDEEPPKVESPKKAQAKMTSFLTKDSKVKAPKEETKGKAGKPLLNSIDSDYNIEFNIKEAFKTKIVTWNVAGLRSSVQKGCVEYLKREAADIICLNEIKVGTEKELPEEIKLAGYHAYWNIAKGEPGVALLSKKKPLKVTNDLPEKFTTDTRLITAEYDDFFLVMCYVVNAGRGLKTLDKRLEWNDVFDEHVKNLDKEKPVIIAGDLNVAHNEIDLANPKGNHKNAGFTKEERDGFSKLLSYGFIDTFRAKNPEQTGAYTFWSYMGNARGKNVGWRLDYFVASERLMDKVVDNVIRATIKGSDHCPVVLFLNM